MSFNMIMVGAAILLWISMYMLTGYLSAREKAKLAEQALAQGRADIAEKLYKGLDGIWAAPARFFLRRIKEQNETLRRTKAGQAAGSDLSRSNASPSTRSGSKDNARPESPKE
jgi:hypothetical protein